MTNMRSSRNPFSRRQLAAFTLVELIISIGMVLILMAGVVKVFKYATDAVGAGLAVSDIVRIQRSTQIVIPTDAQGLVNDVQKCPAIMMDSQQNDPSKTQFPPNSYYRGPLYLDKNDQATNPNGSQFRLDTFSFFTRGSFTRQTGNDNTYISQMGSTYAWISYGHLWLPDNSTTFHPANSADTLSNYPGYGTALTNPNNYYARQWVFGRTAMLILPLNYPLVPPAPYSTDVAVGSSGFQAIITQPINPTPKPPTLSFGSISHDPPAPFIATAAPLGSPAGTPWQIQQSRFDLAGVPSATGDPFKDYFDYCLNSNNTGGPQAPLAAGAPPGAPVYVANVAPYKLQWWFPVDPTAAPSNTNLRLNYRFQANPYPVRSTASGNLPALSSAQMAQTSPAFVDGCVRCYVEYAGDFLIQTQVPGPNYGAVNTAGNGSNWNVCLAARNNVPYVGDGTDFYIDGNNVRHIRWYGLPRSVSGSSILDVTGITVAGNMQTADVFPLAYYMSQSVTAVPNFAPFEQWVYPLGGSAPYFVTNPKCNRYICEWDATPGASANVPKFGRPTMFRITLEVIDSTGRLSSPRVFQYILPVATQ